jgi:SAM-dependent methyltransferase
MTDDEKIARDWINAVERNRVREADIYPQLKAWVHQISATDILDVGCGQGICSDKIDLGLRNYTGIDLSPILIDRAKQLYNSENRHFLTGSIYDLPFLDNSFNAVFSVNLWHLLADLRKASAELSRVLRAKGNFRIITGNPNAYSLWTGFYTDTKIDGCCFEGQVRLADQSVVREILYLHTLEDIARSFEDAGIKMSEVEEFRKSSDGQKQYVSIRGTK